jgi:hypothetical protein
MTVQALIRQAKEVGVELRLVDGKVKASGTRAAVTSMLEPLRQHRAELIEAMTPETRSDLVGWRELDRAYQRHHLTCATCTAAGQGYGLRCGVGAALWTRYEAMNLKDKP